MKTRVIPKAVRPPVLGAFEKLMFAGQALPGTIGHMCNHAVKRRLCKRAQDTFSEVLADTGAGDLCLDLGANIGLITQRMAATGADVICYEPDPGPFARLEANTKDLPNVTLINKAVGAKADHLMLRRAAKWSEDSPLDHTTMSSIVRDDEKMSKDHGVMVEVIDLVDALTRLDRDIRLLNMDIEGAEWDVLQALIKAPVLQRIDCIFVETHERFDPARYIPVFNELQDFAEKTARPYVNLYWV